MSIVYRTKFLQALKLMMDKGEVIIGVTGKAYFLKNKLKTKNKAAKTLILKDQFFCCQ